MEVEDAGVVEDLIRRRIGAGGRSGDGWDEGIWGLLCEREIYDFAGFRRGICFSLPWRQEGRIWQVGGGFFGELWMFVRGLFSSS